MKKLILSLLVGFVTTATPQAQTGIDRFVNVYTLQNNDWVLHGLSLSNSVVVTNLSTFIEGVAGYIGTNISSGISTGLGITNKSGVLSNNIAAGSNITLTAGSNGQITIDAAGGGGFSGAVKNTGASVVGNVPRYTDTTGTNIAPSGVTITGTNMSVVGNISVNALTATNGITIGSGGTNINIPGIYYGYGVVATNTITVRGDEVTTANTTNTFTNKTIDFSGTGNVGKFTDYIQFIYPSTVDGAGATILTNDYTSPLWGLATYNGTADTNVNYARFRVGMVPLDLDTSVELTLKNMAFRVSGSDTDAAEFTIALFSPASSSAYSPTDFTGFSTFINVTSATLSSPAANDIFYMPDTTLNGWAAALTPGRMLVIGIARRNGSNDDSITFLNAAIEYTRTK